MRSLLFILFLMNALNANFAQSPNAKIKPSEKKEIIATIVALLKENYVFTEKTGAIGKALEQKLTSHQYDPYETLEAFADQLNNDLLALSNDRHVQIYYSPKIVRQLRQDTKTDSAPDEEFLQLLKSENFRMRKVEILNGNIGYFKIDNFVELKYCKETLTGAMNFISNSSAMVLDLSECGGGSSETMNFILSYFLPESTKIGELRFRKNNELKEYYTVSDPSLKKLTGQPLYILTSGQTASAAEGLAACLQEYQRAVIVGGPTKGLGNPGELFVINDVLYMFITTAASGTARSGANFDGKGLSPDILVPPSAVAFNFNKAMAEVCYDLYKKAPNKTLKNAGKWLSAEYESFLNSETAEAGYLNSITGQYEGNRTILQENGQLYFDNGSVKRKLTYMGKGVFSAEGRKDYRFYFPLHSKKIDTMTVLWLDDTEDVFKRVNGQ